jgi:hypothetical protein
MILFIKCKYITKNIIGEIAYMEEERTTKEILEELKAKYPIEEQVKFDETDISQKLQDNAFQVIRYKEFYYIELDKYEELERKMEALKGIRYKKYRFEDEQEWTKKEIEDYCLPQDDKIIALKKIMKKQYVKVRYFEMCWRAFEKQGWNMKVFNDRDRMGI